MRMLKKFTKKKVQLLEFSTFGYDNIVACIRGYEHLPVSIFVTSVCEDGASYSAACLYGIRKRRR